MYVTINCTNSIPLLTLYKEVSLIHIYPGVRTHVTDEVWEFQKEHNQEIITQMSLGKVVEEEDKLVEKKAKPLKEKRK